jgi:tRNA(Ile)-lysidine synthase
MKPIISNFVKNIERFGFLHNTTRVCVAVSGGVDSMCLMLLANDFFGASNLHVVTVDHKIRKDSYKDTLYVKKICDQLGLQHSTLTWEEGEKVKSNVQSIGRENRYRLIIEYSQKHNIQNVLTGHNSDDIAEHFFIRLTRASGIAGLIFNEVNFIKNIRILRPMSNISKQECKQYVEYKGFNYVEDPSNQDPKYLRNAIRLGLTNFLNTELKDLLKERVLYIIVLKR